VNGRPLDEVALAVFDGPTHVLQLANAAWCALLGASEIPHAHLDAVFRSGVASQLAELGLRVEAEREVYLRVAIEPVRDKLGQLAGVIVVCTDITDRVVARHLDVDPDALVWGGPTDRGPDFFNGRWRSFTGVTGGAWQAVIHADDLPRCTQAFVEAARQRVSTDIEARLVGDTGAACWHRVRFTIEGSRWFGSAVDIHDTRSAAAERTELVGRERASRADAEQANRLKDQFLAAVSHELRAPLTTMLLWEKVLRDDTADAALHRKALDAIHESAMSQSRLVADLLDVARGISGKLFIDLRPLAIDDLVREAVAAASMAATEKQIELVQEAAPSGGEVQADGHRLRQVLDNLLSNAIKYTEAGGRVSVSTRRTGRSIVIAIEDTGRGIAAEFLPHLFAPFSQTDDALTRAQGGLGLGLSIAHQLVELHGGTLAATSAGRGRGATFTIKLPAIAARTPATASDASPLARPPALDRIRVLVVDDDRRVRDALAILLGRAGAIVETAESAAMARVRLADVVPDALVCDIAMPDEDGYSLGRTLREGSARVRTIPLIALTAHAATSDGQRALASGFDLHLAKPIDLELLVASIHDLVVARRAAETT